MKKLLLVLMIMMISSVTAFAADAKPAFWTPDGIKAYDSNIKEFTKLITEAQELDGNAEKPPVDKNQTRQGVLHAYAVASGMDMQLGWNTSKKHGTIIIKMPGEVYAIQSILMRMEDANRIILSTIDAKSADGLDEILTNKGNLNIMVIDSKGNILGIWKHSMEIDAKKNTFTTNKILLMANVNDNENK